MICMEKKYQPTGREFVFMIVDRHKIIRNVLSEFLTKVLDVEIIETENGLKALSVLESREVDVVITDVHLPLVDGMKLTEIVKANHLNTKVIALSMMDEPFVVNSMVQAGVDAYVLKEGDLEDLMKAIQEVQEGLTYFSPQLISIVQQRFLADSASHTEEILGDDFKTLRRLLDEMSVSDE